MAANDIFWTGPDVEKEQCDFCKKVIGKYPEPCYRCLRSKYCFNCSKTDVPCYPYCLACDGLKFEEYPRVIREKN